MYHHSVPPPPPPPADLNIAGASALGRRHASQSRHDDQRRAVVSPYRQPLAIRMSQAQQRAVSSSSSHLSLAHDHQLRRKTPNGTIDAGYDGSPTQLCAGPPPLKHMILPISAVADSHSHPFYRDLAMEHYGQLPPQLEGGHHANLGAPPWLLVNCTVNGTVNSENPLCQSLPIAQQLGLAWPAGVPGSQNQSANLYQPLMRGCEYNVRAFCPPPTPTADSSAFGQFGWQPWQSDPSIWGPPHARQSGGLPSTPHLNTSVKVAEHQAWTQEPYCNAADFALAQDITQSSGLDIQGLRLDSGVGGGSLLFTKQHAPQQTFKDKVLFHAHQHYLDLLSYLSSVRRVGHLGKGSGLDAHYKPVVYPKAPKLRSDASNAVVQALRYPANATSCSNTILKVDRHVHPFNLSTNGSFGEKIYSMRQKDFTGLGAPATAATHPAPLPVEAHSYPHSHLHPQPNYSIKNTNCSGGRPLPVANARNSLQVVRSLCEQSNWEWIDGLLLGGCLQYGLGHYESALKWFSRVVALDSSHVEAITNMAATLYCLDRQDEAEQHWLMAVRLCPSYLDAAEHLVGLLYRKRNQDAIEVVCYIQQALDLEAGSETSRQAHARSVNGEVVPGIDLPGGRSECSSLLARSTISLDGEGTSSNHIHHINPNHAGFGSSGYALPGSDNGRMLALVHAKGTMLYGLKDIRRASEAFEEAILISVGRHVKSVRDLVRQVHVVLSQGRFPEGVDTARGSATALSPLLLPPEKARKTAQLIFFEHGELPGLSLIPDGAAKRAAMQTTSNALLSLAKIFQDAMSSGNTNASPLQQPPGVGDILALYYLSLSLQESPSTANNVGILLAGIQQPVVSVAGVSAPSVQQVQQPIVPGIASGSGLALALAYYNYGLRLDPKHVHLHTNLGSLLKDIGQLDLAIQMYEKAVSCDATFDIALTNLANAVKDKGRIKDAISYYRRAVASNPGFSEAVCGLLMALNSVCDWHGRGGVFLDSGRYDRWHVDENGTLEDVWTTMRGSGLTKQVVGIIGQQLGDASLWGCNVIRSSTSHKLLLQIRHLCAPDLSKVEKALEGWAGKAWEGARVVRLWERAVRVMQWTWYHDRHVRGKELAASHYARPQLPASLTVPSAPTVLPFHTFTCPLSARDIRKISQTNAIRISCSTLRSSWLSPTIHPPPPPPHPHLNVGYISSDFNNHPLAHLMQSVFGFHNPLRVRAVCYATTPSDRSKHRQQIEREAPVFRDVSAWSPDKLIEQIMADQIHILVNLNGYTRGARNEIFAARPAPIQMSFMGFAGTLGAEWCDYILADTTAIPPKTLRPWRGNMGIEDVFRDKSEGNEPDWMYSENIIFCRDTFFCCDHAQSCSQDEVDMTWEDEEMRRWKMRKELFPSLPDDAIILANFNQLYKIEPTTFRSWLRILAQTPKAILWLLKFPELGESNLRRTAELWAGSEVASRVVFTDVAQKCHHISRARVCDLFLDTPECNAHTTAADVLWSSTPLLTLPRYTYKMCSRMAASILRGALPKSPEGLSAARQLIAGDETEYEESAAALAGGLSYSTSTGHGKGHGRLAEIRKLLWESKWTCALFNTRRWVNDVEEAYEEAWRRWVAGQGGDIYL